MKDDESKRVSVNHCVRDDEIEAAQKLCDEADPGEWYARGGRVQRFNGVAVGSDKSLALMAAARSLVPRLLRGIRALEDALRVAWTSEAGWRREYNAEVERHRQTARRGAEAARADGGIHAIAALLAYSDPARINVDRVADFLQRWQGGEDVAAVLKDEIDDLRRRRHEAIAGRAETRRQEQEILAEARRIIQENKGKKR